MAQSISVRNKSQEYISKTIFLDDAKMFTSEIHDPCVEQPVPENKKTQRKAFKRGVRCGAGQIPSEG